MNRMTEQRSAFGNSALARETERFLVQMVVLLWQSLVWMFGVGNLTAGLILAFGPPRYRASPNYGVFDLLSLPEQTYPVALALSGVLILISIAARLVWVSVGAHSVAFIAMFWWGFIAVGFLLDGQSSSGAGALYLLMLAFTHLAIVIAKVRTWYVLNGGRNG